MALNIDSIRNFAGTGSIMLDQQGTGVEKSALQRFTSFFNIGDARMKNAETLTAIHHAILNDPRFAAQDIQSEAARLLSQVRTDRAIDAAKIKGIIQTLDNLLLNTEAAVKERVTLRLAAKMPDWAAGHEREVAGVVLAHVLKGQAAAGGYAAIDVAGRVNEALDNIRAAIAHAGDDPDLKDLVFSTLGRTMIAIDGTLASRQKVQQRINTFRDDLDAINTRAQRSADPAVTRQLGIDFIKTLGKPVHPGVIGVIDDFATSLPYKQLGALGPNSSASDIIRAVHRFSELVRTTMLDYPQGSEPLVGGEEVVPAQTYIIQRAISELPPAARQNLLAAFESKEGLGACAYIASQASNGSATGDFNTVTFVCRHLQAEAGKPLGYPGGYDRKAFISTYSPIARCAFNPAHAIGGTAAEPLRAAILGPHQFNRAQFPAEALHAKIDAAAKSMLTGTFAVEMKKLATGQKPTFDIDIVRGMDIRLPDGTKVARDAAQARDQFARLVTGNTAATYATLGAADKTKANAFLALLSQETEKAAQIGIPMGLCPTGTTTQYNSTNFFEGPQPVRSFEITGSPTDGFTIHYQGSYPTPFLLYQGANGQMQQTPMGQKIVCNYEYETHISQAAFNQVAQTDWSQFDSSACDAILAEREHPNRLADSLNAIPPNFRLEMDLTAGFSILADAAPSAK